MEIIPLVVLENQKIRDNPAYLKGKLGDINEGERIYILDLDGIEKDDPNLFLYQEMASYYDTWIDCGPRTGGAVLDVFMEGATNITIRKNLCPSLNISDIREISENKIYMNIDFEKQNSLGVDDLFLDSSDGLVNFNGKEKIEQNLRYTEYLSRVKDKTYCYESDAKNRFFWQQFGVQGLIVDLRKIKEFKNGF